MEYVHSSVLFQTEVSCGNPFPPANGIIEHYSRTQVGSEVQYRCSEGYTPREWRTSLCQENGMWTPDPALLNCSTGVSIL